jgi:hypothetical protein
MRNTRIAGRARPEAGDGLVLHRAGRRGGTFRRAYL